MFLGHDQAQKSLLVASHYQPVYPTLEHLKDFIEGDTLLIGEHHLERNFKTLVCQMHAHMLMQLHMYSYST